MVPIYWCAIGTQVPILVCHFDKPDGKFKFEPWLACSMPNHVSASLNKIRIVPLFCLIPLCKKRSNIERINTSASMNRAASSETLEFKFLKR